MLRVRFAPSPTGYLHIGGARTCLFNWLYARKHKGEFVLRIEDTDLQRSKKEYLDEILESIKWLGMDWDDMYYQSQRFEIYRQHAQKLIDEGKAYRKEGAVFFKYDFETVEIDDLIRGKIIFNELPKNEEVIIKSDNSPTYNFCCAIDDALMKINTIVRGEDHISNTPKQILMYKALGFEVPKFAHVPLILSPDGGRLSKRFGATSIREYKELGYLPEAISNYLMLLGWSPGQDREVFTLDEVKEIFEITDVNKTGAVLSLDKLNWVNSEYIRASSDEKLVSLFEECLSKDDFLPSWVNQQYMKKIVELFKERTVKLSDLFEKTRFCFYDDFTYSEDSKSILEKDLSSQVGTLINNFSSMEDFNKQDIENMFRGTIKDLGIKMRDLVHPVRIALTGRKDGPGLFETIEVLGKKRALQRLNRLVDYWKKGG